MPGLVPVTARERCGSKGLRIGTHTRFFIGTGFQKALSTKRGTFRARPMFIGKPFEAYVQPEPNTGCHLWAGAVSGRGYGYYRGRRAHRVAYEATFGAIPQGLVLDHLCRQPLCVNPKHLEAVTHRTNSMRGLLGDKWCRDESHSPRKTSKGQCRDCNLLYLRRWRAANASHVND